MIDGIATPAEALLVAAAEPNTAYAVLNAAAQVTEHDRREMTLAEALEIVRGVAAQVEALGT